MSKRLTLYIVWGFYVGALFSICAFVFSGGVNTLSEQSFIIVFATAIVFALIAGILARYLNRKGRPDTTLQTWEVLWEFLVQNCGLGLIPILSIVTLLILLSQIFQIRVLGF